MSSSRISSLRLDALLSNAREPAFLLGSDRRLAGVNRAFEELVGYPSERLIGLLCNPLGPTRAGDLAELGGSFYPPPEALAGQPAGGTTLIYHAGGERHWRRVEFWPFHDVNGGLLGLFGIVRSMDGPHQVPDSEVVGLRLGLLNLRARLERAHGFDALIGSGPAHRRLLDQTRAAASSGVTVLILGEPGTGKRTVARTIHTLSTQGHAPLFPFDPSALPSEVLARELFGKHGQDEPDSNPSTPRLSLPEGSTVLLNEVLELPRDLQAQLALALDGSVRLIATSSSDPEAAIKADRLRPDLYYALTSLVIRLQPLRERLEELPLLAQHLLERANTRADRPRAGFTSEAIEALRTYDWPGNLRELARVIETTTASASGDLIALNDIPAAIRGHLGGAYLPPPPPSPMPLDELMTSVERRLIEQALARARHNKSRAAEMLGISRPRLYRRIKELGIADQEESPDEPRPVS